MNILIWLIAGAALGWLASIVIRRRRPILVLDIVVGMVGAFVAGFLLLPVFRVSIINQGIISLPALMISMGGAVLLLAVVNFFYREKNVKNEVIERRWPQVRGKIHTRWDKITEEDVAKIDGNYDRFIVTIQARYSCSKKEAEDQIQRYLQAVLGNSRRSFVYDRA